MSSAMHEECGVFGIYAPGKDVARMTGFGLQALQHRGQESAGIAVGDGETVNVSKDLGLVTQVFDDDSLNALVGDVAIGHVRYSTSGSKASWEAAQPHMSAMGEVLLALAHNGTLTNTNKLRARLIADGARLYSSTDSEVAAKLIGMYTERTNHLREGIRHAMELMEGAYAMVLCTADGLYAFRDPHGIRPLCIGKLPDDAGWVISSETCGLDIVGATYVRDVEPGEVVRVNDEGLRSFTAVEPARRASCVFEYVYFARPDSVIDGQSVYQARRDTGRILARENPVEADLVLGVPDSGVPAALGYAAESGIEYTDGIVKNRYVGRTFIQPTDEMRQLGIRPVSYTHLMCIRDSPCGLHEHHVVVRHRLLRAVHSDNEYAHRKHDTVLHDEDLRTFYEGHPARVHGDDRDVVGLHLECGDGGHLCRHLHLVPRHIRG